MQEHLNIDQEKIEKIESAFGEFKKFRQFMMMYNCAIKEVQTKFEILNDELFTRKLKSNLKTFEVKNSASKIYDEIVKIVGVKNEKNN